MRSTGDRKLIVVFELVVSKKPRGECVFCQRRDFRNAKEPSESMPGNKPESCRIKNEGLVGIDQRSIEPEAKRIQNGRRENVVFTNRHELVSPGGDRVLDDFVLLSRTRIVEGVSSKQCILAGDR